MLLLLLVYSCWLLVVVVVVVVLLLLLLLLLFFLLLLLLFSLLIHYLKFSENYLVSTVPRRQAIEGLRQCGSPVSRQFSREGFGEEKGREPFGIIWGGGKSVDSRGEGKGGSWKYDPI